MTEAVVNKLKSQGIILLKVYSTKEAAAVIGVDRKLILKHIKEGLLPTKKIGRGFKLLGEDLIRFLRGQPWQ